MWTSWLWPDPLGTRRPRFNVQVKRQQQAVSAEGLRSFMAVRCEDDLGLFVCTRGFTKYAEAEALTQEKRRITQTSIEAKGRCRQSPTFGLTE